MQWTRVENRDPVKRYNKMSVADLGKLAPGYDWKAALGAAGDGNKLDTIIVNQPSYFEGLNAVLAKIHKQAKKDYVVHPLLSLPTGSFLPTLAANFTANVVRNLWSHSIIMCGHFPEGVETFEKTSIEGETRGEWYVRQMLGSANISGSKLLHIMSGNLSHQIEHHLFPDLPARRYAELSQQVRSIAARYGQTYNSGRLSRQFASVLQRVWIHRLPTAGSV
ncbi:MAG: NADPH-dependent stearoyl-CoA 9-desaturase [Pseudomonas citronellolis]|nr:MAG: NADPH-dependent stearoyl-CoA 9-desaturase [Pseudomonas citronellolis]